MAHSKLPPASLAGAQVSDWSGISDSTVQTMCGIVLELAAVREKVCLAEKLLTVDSFTKAAQCIHKLGNSKNVRAAKDLARDCQSSHSTCPRLEYVVSHCFQ